MEFVFRESRCIKRHGIIVGYAKSVSTFRANNRMSHLKR